MVEQPANVDLAGQVVAAPAVGWWVGATTGLFALMVSAVSISAVVTDRHTRLAVLTRLNVLGTIVHEAGHAAVSVLTGGGVYRLRITSRDSGATYSWWPSRLSSIATSAAGYAMPPLAGLGAAVLLHRGHVNAVLILTVVLMALLLSVARDVRTIVVVAFVGAVASSVARWAPDWLQAWVAYAEAWLLLTSEIGGVAALVAGRLDGAPDHDDADALADETYIPAIVWIAGWLTLNGWALWHAVPLLL